MKSFKITWPKHTRPFNNAPASDAELKEMFDKVVASISGFDTNQPYAIIKGRLEVAQELANRIMADNSNNLHTGVPCCMKGDSYDIVEHCKMGYLVVAKDKITFDRATTKAVSEYIE